MITVEEYRDRVLALAAPLPATTVPATAALGLVLAGDARAELAVPPFTNSSMDGFAVRAADVAAAPVTLPVAADTPAGAPPGDLAPGTAVRIMTGAPLPAGADAVVRVEDTDHAPGIAAAPATVRIGVAVAPGTAVRAAGGDVAVGDVVAGAGERVGPALLAGLVAAGVRQLRARPRPRVAVLTTGAELVAPGEAPAPGQIPDSNLPLLAGLAGEWGAEVALAERTDDDPAAFAAALARATAAADLVLTAGGVSAGAFEVVRQVVADRGVGFASVAMQPGKPQGSGVVAGTPVVCLPGNPVSVFVSGHVFVRPLLAALAGRDPGGVPRTVPVRAADGWRKPPGRRQYLPVAVDADGGCRPAHRLGSASHSIASLHRADALAIVPADWAEVAPGTELRAIWTRSEP